MTPPTVEPPANGGLTGRYSLTNPAPSSRCRSGVPSLA
jgi:hypothetical protein